MFPSCNIQTVSRCHIYCVSHSCDTLQGVPDVIPHHLDHQTWMHALYLPWWLQPCRQPHVLCLSAAHHSCVVLRTCLPDCVTWATTLYTIINSHVGGAGKMCGRLGAGPACYGNNMTICSVRRCDVRCWLGGMAVNAAVGNRCRLHHCAWPLPDDSCAPHF